MELQYSEFAADLNQTKRIAEKIAGILKPGDLLVINGDLGSGKTTLVRFICEYYGIANVSSPTFSIVNEYMGNIKIYHFDFYRIKKVEELYDLGFEDYSNDESALIFIEWGSLMREIIPQKHYELTITVDDSEIREFKLFRNV